MDDNDQNTAQNYTPSFNNGLAQNSGQQDDAQTQKRDKSSVVNVGASSPEMGPASLNVETTPSAESGYEQIRRIERAAETREKKEVVHKLKKPKDKKQEKKKKKKSQKQIQTPLSDIKYFGYKPPKKYLTNIKRLKSRVGKGDIKDSTTWLLVFLDRILRKESL